MSALGRAEALEGMQTEGFGILAKVPTRHSNSTLRMDLARKSETLDSLVTLQVDPSLLEDRSFLLDAMKLEVSMPDGVGTGFWWVSVHYRGASLESHHFALWHSV